MLYPGNLSLIQESRGESAYRSHGNTLPRSLGLTEKAGKQALLDPVRGGAFVSRSGRSTTETVTEVEPETSEVLPLFIYGY